MMLEGLIESAHKAHLIEAERMRKRGKYRVTPCGVVTVSKRVAIYGWESDRLLDELKQLVLSCVIGNSKKAMMVDWSAYWDDSTVQTEFTVYYVTHNPAPSQINNGFFEKMPYAFNVQRTVGSTERVPCDCGCPPKHLTPKDQKLWRAGNHSLQPAKEVQPEGPWRWLRTALQLQIDSYDTDPSALEGDELADFITWNVTALMSELGEFLNEVGWKNWAKPRGWVNRDAAIGELVDSAHFLANLCSALGVTDEEWESRYQGKQLVNARRQADGYDSVSGKCKVCHRDLAESSCAEETCNARVVDC